jgi:ligand-binding sensor domain-containing protein/signal transduction histidine kinase
MANTPKEALTCTLRSLLLSCWLIACYQSAYALNPQFEASQYAHTSWKIRDGFSKGQINAIAQTPDGYLWLGTHFGLLRFDGVRTVPFQPPADQPSNSAEIFELFVARDGTLWIGSDQGLSSWDGSRLTQYPQLARQFVLAVLEDHDGTIWAGSLNIPNGRLCTIRRDNVECFGQDGTLGRGVVDLFEDSQRNLWALGSKDLWRWKPAPSKSFTMQGYFGRESLLEDSDGALMIGTEQGIKRLSSGKMESYPVPGTTNEFIVSSMLRDRDGALWIAASSAGLLHVHQGRTDVFSSADGLSGDQVSAMFEDREGTIWVATTKGLDRFREQTVSTFSEKQGLSSSVVFSALATSDGSVLAVTNYGLNRWSNGQIRPLGRVPTGVEERKNSPRSLFQDSRGRIWSATATQFGYLENDRFVALRGIPGGVTRSIADDHKGNLWVANQNSGLFQLRDNQVLQNLSWEKLGHSDFGAALEIDRVSGGLWVGFFGGGVVYFKDGEVRASYAADAGLGAGRVDDLQFDRDGALWISTQGGLSRLKDNRIATITQANGLPCDEIHWMRADDFDRVWLNTACGLVQVTRAELRAWAAAVDQNKDIQRKIPLTVFDTSDGVRSRSYSSGFYPQVATSVDGKLWFPVEDGLSVIDPHHLSFNTLLPPVQIQQVVADRKTYNANGQIHLPPLNHDLEIDYTALSFVAPEKIRFRYKLEGYDRDWQEAGDRRQAFYTNLPPRNYRFRVIACNNSGVWNETGAFLDFSIAPAYYQTTWFRLLLVLAVLLVLFALYRLRVRQVAQQVRAGIEGRLDERERIARDLHDTLLQSVQGLILKFHAGIKQIPSDIPARETMEKALDHADQVLAEGRDRVRNLRATSVSIDDLALAFTRVATETTRGREATFKTVVEGGERRLHPLVQEEAYCIGREAIINALTHSGGANVEVEIIYESRKFGLRVRDNGSGIASQILEEGGRSDHWGMQGMRERANKIGAELRIWSGHATGTEVELTVPGATAYQGNRESNRSWSAFFQKLIKQ